MERKLKPGDRVRLISMPQDPHPIPIGTLGTVLEVHYHRDWFQVEVAWDMVLQLMQKNKNPDLHWHITRTLEIIEELQEPIREQLSVPPLGSRVREVSILENLAKGSSIGGCSSPHRRYT